MPTLRIPGITSKAGRMRRALVGGVAGVALAMTALVAAPAAGATSTPAASSSAAKPLGVTTVTTAPAIAPTLLKAGILPLPVFPKTSFGVSLKNGLAVSYGFPITSNTANLAQGKGDILHAGGINFVSRHAKLEIGKFDINLAAGKIFAKQVNFAPANIPVLDLDLSKLKVTKTSRGTLLSGITLKLDPAAAGALNSTFHIALPTNGSLVFGSATVLIKG